MKRKTVAPYALVVAMIVLVACEPGQFLGPSTAKVTVGITSLMTGDTLTPYINFEPYEPKLTDQLPSKKYRPRIQTREQQSSSGVENGQIYVGAWSANLGCMSRTKQKGARTDEVVAFEFGPSDFYSSSCR